MLNEARAEAELSKVDNAELEELREMKSDVDRKERAHAQLIADQARRLEQLETLYKEEQVNRKRYFNMMEDMKGKIRVYARVRPMLKFEKDNGQKPTLMTPDELTVAHMWKEEKKPREYPFDQVFTSEVTQACSTSNVPRGF